MTARAASSGLALLLLSGCTSGFGVGLTLAPRCIAGASTVDITATLTPQNRTQTRTVPAQPFLSTGHRVAIVVPDGTTSVSVSVVARDSQGAQLGSGSVSVPVSGHQLVEVTLTLDAPACADAGPSDLASSGGSDASDAGISYCPSFALFCDDFETGTLGRWSSKFVGPSMTLDVARTQAHSGTVSLEVTAAANTTGTQGAHLERTGLNFPLGYTQLAVRFYALWPSAPAPDGTLLRLLMGGGNEYDVGVSSGKWILQHGSTFVNQVAVVPAWTCVEVILTRMPPDGGGTDSWLIQLLVDGRAAGQFSGLGYDPNQQYFGLRPAINASEDVFLDDYAIALQPIGCN